ncbi:MAG: DinB family protein [Deltaproteobacteria bacterium]|nr:DinB family protein [Deltaproteobacteria bacterium]
MFTTAKEELQDLSRQFEAAMEQKRQLVQDLSSTQLLWQPTDKKWSMAHCLDHLNIVGRGYLSAIVPAAARGREKGQLSEAPSRHGLFGGWFVRSMEPPPKMRFKAPGNMQPAPIEDPFSTSEAFDQLQRDCLAQISNCEGLDLSRIIVVSPFARVLRLRLGAVMALVPAHQRRHLWQMEQIRAAEGFPDH